MGASKTGVSKRVLLKGALNFDLGDGRALRLSEDGETLETVTYHKSICEPIVLPMETFLRAVGFTINNQRDLRFCYIMVLDFFFGIKSIKFNHFRNFVKSMDVAVQDIDSIELR